MRSLRQSKSIVLPSVLSLIVGCNSSNNAPTHVHAPGAEKSAKSKALEAGAEALQDMPPVQQINMYLDGFHFYADDAGRQVEAHHYCSHLNEDFHQCVIYDGNGKDAKLIGVEYIISERTFKSLPEDEKKYWHSHRYEVKSGTLVMPGIPDVVEKEAMEQLVTTYGKTWHTWQYDRGDKLPYGIPQLMMGFTKEGQVNPQLVRDRDARMKLSTDAKRKNREGIPMPEVQPGANAWETGKTPQLKADSVDVKNPKPGE